jgi:hypothetical protein
MDALVNVTDGGIELDADGAIERLSGTVVSPPAKIASCQSCPLSTIFADRFPLAGPVGVAHEQPIQPTGTASRSTGALP